MNDLASAKALETYRSMVQYGVGGLKFVLVSNGAAAIALMTFLGHMFARDGFSGLGPDFRVPLGCFVIGVFLGGVATATSYFTQLALFNEELEQPLTKPFASHEPWLWTTISLLFAGILLFGVGAFMTVWKLQ